MSAWQSLETFSSRFKLSSHVRDPLVHDLFEPSTAFAHRLVNFSIEIQNRSHEFPGSTYERPAAELDRFAHRYVDSLFLGIIGMYSAGAVVLRSGVTALFQSIDAEPGIRARAQRNARNRGRPPVSNSSRLSPSVIRDASLGTPYHDIARHIYDIYDGLSKVNYGDRGFTEPDRYLRALPTLVPADATRYKRTLEKIGVYGTELLAERFRPVSHFLIIDCFPALIAASKRLRDSAGMNAPSPSLASSS